MNLQDYKQAQDVYEASPRYSHDESMYVRNEGCLGGGGVDGAITKAGGAKLHEASGLA